jgi:hypothetical protein
MMTDIFLKDEGEFVTIGFQTEKAKAVLKNDNVLSKLQYSIGEGILPKIDFPISGLEMIKKFLKANDLTFEEC